MTPSETELLVTLAKKIQQRYPEGLPAWTTERVDLLTDQMVETYPDAGTIDEIIGLGFTTRGLAQYWGCSPSTIRRQAGAGTLLALKTAKRAWVYPVFQLDADGSVVAGLREVIVVLTELGLDPWEAARWLATSPLEPSPIELLRAGDFAAALARAQQLNASRSSPQRRSAPR